MASEYCDVFLKSLPAEKRENVAAILKVTNLPINKRLEYLADDLDRRELKICKQVIKIEVCVCLNSSYSSFLKEIDDCSTEREEESDRDDLKELQKALEEKNETIKQLRKELAVNLDMTAEHLEKIATLEKATASEKERGCESAAVQRRFLKKEEEFKQENKRNGDQIRKLNEKIADNEAVITELLENLEKARKALDIEKEACKRLLARAKEEIFLKNDLTPFPFLANEPLDTVQIVHTAIQKYTQREADKVDSAILLFLTEENKSAYETWKDELRDGIPTALLNLSIETKEEIMTYFTEKYTPKPGRMQRTLDEIMAIAHKMLESFLNLKKPETSTTVLRSEPLGNIANLVRPEPHEQNKGNRNSFKMETIPENETSRTVQSAVKHCEDKAAQVSDFPYVEGNGPGSSEFVQDDSILLNILLIGDAVGKSAFINAFQNYLNKESLDKGLQTGPFVRESFDVTVEMDMKPLTVHIDSPSRSDLNIRFLQKRKGTPVVIHGFYDAGRKIQLISTSEAEKEDEEFGYTIDAIKGLERIHAICFLLKSNEGRFSSDFIQALDILRHLPKTAIQNIVFCSTTTDFMPLPTLRVLKEYLVAFEKRTKIRIPASRENIFCFDNASFLFQCLVSKCPQYVGLKKQYVKSWNNDIKQLQE